jgi:hypothetical protein
VADPVSVPSLLLFHGISLTKKGEGNDLAPLAEFRKEVVGEK